jgi:hypothetical protein
MLVPQIRVNSAPDVGEVEGDELGSAHRGCVAEQDDRGVADAVRGGPVDAADDPADVVDGQWPRQAARCRAVRPSQSPPDLPHRLGGGRVGHADGAVHVPDDGAGQVEGAGGAAGFGAFGQVGAHGERVRGHGGDAAVGAPALPLAPDQVVLAAGLGGVGGGKRFADAVGVHVRESRAHQVGVVGGRGRQDVSRGGRQGGEHERVHRPVVAAPAQPPSRRLGRDGPHRERVGHIRLTSGPSGKPRVVEEVPHRTASTVSERLGTVAGHI